MKRVLPILVVLALLAGIAGFLLLRGGAVEGAQLVPAGTSLYLTVPNLKRTLDRWPKTALAQIAAEPAVADFLRKPLEQLATDGGLEAMDQIFRVKPGRLFVAVTDLRKDGVDVVLGFEYFGSRKDLDGAMDRLYRELGKLVPGITPSSADYQGDTMTSFSGPTASLFSGAHGSWGFLSNREGALKQALDRAAGRDHSPALAGTDDFQKVLGHLSANPDFLWYGKPESLFNLLLEIGKQQKETVNAQQLEQLRKVKALGGTLLLDGAEQKETSFILYPDAPKLKMINRSAMALTTPETAFFYEGTMDMETISSDGYYQSLPPEAQTFLTHAGIDLKQIPQIFGSDLGLVLSWPTDAMIPTALFAIEVKDRARAQSIFESLFTNLGVETSKADQKGATVFGFPGLKLQLVEPVFAVSDKFALASVTTPELERVLALPPGAPTLETSDAFKPALGLYKKDAAAFGYLDSKGLFERVYNLVKPIAILAGMSSSVGTYVDLSKLPDTETISRHLTPVLYTNRQVADGLLIESTGPITLSQAAIFLATGAGAGYAAQMMGGE